MGERARREVVAEYDLKVAGAKLLALYAESLGVATRGGGVKILVLSNLYPPDVIGGYELGCRQAVDALRALGHDVRVLTTAPRVPVERRAACAADDAAGRCLERLPLHARTSP